MSLLTNEQIEELVGITSNQSTSQDLFIEFFDWNEKQTGTQINVNWDDAPKFAGKAVLRLHWVTGSKGSELWTASEDAITLERPKPIITPHPHAEMIMKYAEVAARRIDPWVEFEITFDEDDDCWSKCPDELRFLVNGRRYRHIGDNK
jgi:hypothetical protein